MSETCDACGDAVSDALARTISLSVDRSQIDTQRLCPDCFAAWINRYEAEMRPDSDSDADDGSETAGVDTPDDDADIIVD